MIAMYDYDINLSVPGGQITLDGITGLISKILVNIPIQLLNLTQSRDNILHITFANTLNPGQQTTLDTFINQAGDYFEVLVDNIPIPFFLPATVPSDGQIHLTITLQRKQGNGAIRLGTSETVTVRTDSILALDPRTGNFDPLTGQFQFFVGPDHHRGTTTCIIYATNLPSRRLAVEFT